MFVALGNNQISLGSNSSFAMKLMSTTASVDLHFFHEFLRATYYVSKAVSIKYIHCMPLPQNSGKWTANIKIHICNGKCILVQLLFFWRRMIMFPSLANNKISFSFDNCSTLQNSSATTSVKSHFLSFFCSALHPVSIAQIINNN